MRQIVLDTETTGLEYRLGDRVIEIGCVEMAARKLTGRNFHCYINPEREVEAGALAVHGISNEFLQDKPRFAQIAPGFLDFVRGAELVIHNAPFDIGFLNHELGLMGQGRLEEVCAGVVDTLKLAKELHPGKKNSLDALCERYGVDNAHRKLHGALLDCELLADVYLAMTRGQESLVMDLEEPPSSVVLAESGERLPLRVIVASEEEQAAHAALLADIDRESKGKCVWLKREAEASA